MDREISIRLEEALRAQVAFADNLRPALALASRQLELLCPAVAGVTNQGVVATLATPLPRGTWLIVLANQRKVLTIQFLTPPKKTTRLQILEEYVARVTGALGHTPTRADVIDTIFIAVDKHGGKPGKQGPSVDPSIILQILGLLFGAASTDERVALVKGVERVIAEDVCPLHVGLTGRGSIKDTRSGVWPLGLPFAPYVESLGL